MWNIKLSGIFQNGMTYNYLLPLLLYLFSVFITVIVKQFAELLGRETAHYFKAMEKSWNYSDNKNIFTWGKTSLEGAGPKEIV